MIKQIMIAIWNYINGMNTGTDGKLSINRNMAWGVATIWLAIEGYTVVVLPRLTETEINHYNKLCLSYVIINAVFVTLALSITSIEKITELVKKIKGGIFQSEQAPAKEVPPDIPSEKQ